jgi:hypothetical protein
VVARARLTVDETLGLDTFFAFLRLERSLACDLARTARAWVEEREGRRLDFFLMPGFTGILSARE